MLHTTNTCIFFPPNINITAGRWSNPRNLKCRATFCKHSANFIFLWVGGRGADLCKYCTTTEAITLYVHTIQNWWLVDQRITKPVCRVHVQFGRVPLDGAILTILPSPNMHERCRNKPKRNPGSAVVGSLVVVVDTVTSL